MHFIEKIISVYTIILLSLISTTVSAKNYVIDNDDPYLIELSYFNVTPQPGDTIFISTKRSKGIIFENLIGDSLNSIVITNTGGLVNINDTLRVLALELRNSKYVKISGKGEKEIQYGFKLGAKNVGISLGQLSSDIEIENVEIDHTGFFGIVAKKDFNGNPPIPIPLFKNLIIHDCLIKNVTEGMYIGETKTPGMEFKHVKLFNNIITETGREGIQISNGVEDIKVYNNLFHKNGKDGTYAHGNNLQIGDNTEAQVFNNIFNGAFQFGVIVLGKGDINIYNNYFESNEGIFIDNRKITDILSPITISNNYFYSVTDNQIIKNFNQLNSIAISNNYYNEIDNFYSSNNTSCTNTKLYENSVSDVSRLIYKGSYNGRFVSAITNNANYSNLGPLSSIIDNTEPEILIDSTLYKINTTLRSIPFNVYDSDDDIVTTTLLNAPEFIELKHNESNQYSLTLNKAKVISGTYLAVIEANDGFGGVTTKSITISLDSYILNDNTINIYPNPFTSCFKINTSKNKITSYHIYTTNGHLVKSAHLNDLSSENIDLSSFSSGVYIVKICTATDTISKLITKH